jgi:hypothetical protein
MTFLTDLAAVRGHLREGHRHYLQNSNNALAGVFLHTHAKEIAALVEAVQDEHGGEINNPRCPICIALAALDKEKS